MLNAEKLLKDLKLGIARFGDSDVAMVGSPSPYRVDPLDAHGLHREIAAKLGFKME